MDAERNKKMMSIQDVDVVEADQCMFGLRTRSAEGTRLAKKPTKFMTNPRAIGEELRNRCDESHEHQQLLDGRAAKAARYQEGLCKAICRGILEQKKERRMQSRAVMQVDEGYQVRRLNLEEFHDPEQDARMR